MGAIRVKLVIRERRHVGQVSRAAVGQPIPAIEQRGADTDRDRQVRRTDARPQDAALRRRDWRGVDQGPCADRQVAEQDTQGTTVPSEHVECGHDGSGLRDGRSVDAGLVRPVEGHGRRGGEAGCQALGARIRTPRHGCGRNR